MAHADSQGQVFMGALYDWYGLAKVGGGFIESSDGLVC